MSTPKPAAPLPLVLVDDYTQPGQADLPEPTEAFGLHRQAVRAVIVDAAGAVYLMHATRFGYYKLPGGGMDPGETRAEALHREIAEETGFRVEIGAGIGRTVQYDRGENFRQDSFCYLARLLERGAAPALTASEQAAGFEVAQFPNIGAAIRAVMSSRVEGRECSMILREAALLAAAGRKLALK